MSATRQGQPASKRSRRKGVPLSLVRPPERIRWSKIVSAQARMASDYYDREEVQGFLVEALLQELKRH